MASTDPRTATQGQWENLADRVQSKAEIGSVLSTPSNVAYVGTNNIVDAAVTTAKISNGSVTADKISNGAVTTDKINNGAVTEDKLGLSYSTSEQATGKTWTDGKTIYKKTVDFGNFASGGMTVANALPADSEVIRMEGYFLNGGVYMNADHYYSSGQWGRLKVTKSTGTVKIDLGSDYGSGAAKATFYYTKSS